ncbi:hypothetical protein HMPREF0591_1560 [Mycobacterium parascrofulaceum ATCC BAA-614]|uniref:Uncharacterized protein n=1 Tax=Mycobacterium parascrofulaceum ATCC BAA-614 TaxID=525368 RepID=D5P5W6_9MYCO|nr:hypothetical protein HMPREF0591_1560 [Mycobacterium parascrofulaceum ATCC BAA-614]
MINSRRGIGGENFDGARVVADQVGARTPVEPDLMTQSVSGPKPSPAPLL